MWKIFLLEITCISLVCGQCNSNLPCHGRTAYHAHTSMAHQQQNLTEYTNNASTKAAPSYNPAAPVPTSYYPSAPGNGSYNPAAPVSDMYYPATAVNASLYPGTSVNASYYPAAPVNASYHPAAQQPALYYPLAPLPTLRISNATSPTSALTNNTYTPQSYLTSTPVPTVQNNTNTTRQTPSAYFRPTSPIIFPDQYDNTEIPSESFTTKLFQLLSGANANQNLLFSPMSLQTLLSFIYTISEGKLSEELSLLLELPQNRSDVAQKYQELTNRPYNSNVNNTFIMANKLYYEERFGLIHQNIRNMAATYFASDVEPLDFVASQKAANMINSWIAEKTRNLIKQIITQDSLGEDTRAVLINSLYFKSEWQQKFSTYDTEKQPFFLSQQRQVVVDMMYMEEVVLYGEFEELKAKVVELPYQLDDFRMMIILPNAMDDLAEVEKRLAKVSLKSIAERLQKTEVTVRLPQFATEFEMDMVSALQQLGLYSLFNDEARIKLFKNQNKPLYVDQIKQKSFISVNEAGTEAAAVTFAKFVPLSIPLRMKQFTVDHPFIFIIRNSKAVYFMGHMTHFKDQQIDNLM